MSCPDYNDFIILFQRKTSLFGHNIYYLLVIIKKNTLNDGSGDNHEIMEDTKIFIEKPI